MLVYCYCLHATFKMFLISIAIFILYYYAGSIFLFYFLQISPIYLYKNKLTFLFVLTFAFSLFNFLLILYRSLQYEPVPLTESNYIFLITNSNIHHELSSSQYQLRRYQCEEASDLLNVQSLRSATMDSLNSKINNILTQ